MGEGKNVSQPGFRAQKPDDRKNGGNLSAQLQTTHLRCGSCKTSKVAARQLNCLVVSHLEETAHQNPLEF